MTPLRHPVRKPEGAENLKRAKNLGPDGDHPEKKADGREGCGFFDNGTEHDDLHERRENIVQCLF